MFESISRSGGAVIYLSCKGGLSSLSPQVQAQPGDDDDDDADDDDADDNEDDHDDDDNDDDDNDDGPKVSQFGVAQYLIF